MIMRDTHLFSIFNTTKKPEVPDCNHENIVFVDDLSQTIGDKHILNLQHYIQELYETTVRYFTVNRLSINCSKTEILLVPYGGKDDTKLYIITKDGEKIESKNEVKLLGIKFNAANNMSSFVFSRLPKLVLHIRNSNRLLRMPQFPRESF